MRRSRQVQTKSRFERHMHETGAIYPALAKPAALVAHALPFLILQIQRMDAVTGDWLANRLRIRFFLNGTATCQKTDAYKNDNARNYPFH